MILSIITFIIFVILLVLNWFLQKQHEKIEAFYKEQELFYQLYIKELQQFNAELQNKIIELSKQQ